MPPANSGGMEINMKKWTLILAAVLALCCPVTMQAEEITPSITVQGSGRVTVTPDLGTISFAVTQEGQEAADVQKAITENANTVKGALFDAGLPEDQFKTSGIQLNARYDYSSDVERIVGYTGQISMSVNEISLDDIGKYLQILSETGVNQIDGISVSYSDYEDAYQEALGKAMEQARQKAEALAKAEGAEVTDQFTATEGYQDASLRSRGKNIAENYAVMMSEDSAMGDTGGLDYSAGTTEVEAIVTVCYAIDTGTE